MRSYGVNLCQNATRCAATIRGAVYNFARAAGAPLKRHTQPRVPHLASIHAPSIQKIRVPGDGSLLRQRIAEKEDIKVSQTEAAARVQHLGRMYQITPEKFLKDLQKRNGLIEIYDQIMNEKVVDFLQNNAKIEEVQQGQLSAVNPG